MTRLRQGDNATKAHLGAKRLSGLEAQALGMR